jgi:integrase
MEEHKMASLNRERRGGREIGWRIRWVEADGRQVTLRLGDITRRNAERMLLLVERLLEARRLGVSLDSETARWVSELSPEMAQRLAKAGLTEAKRRITLGEFLKDYLARRPDVAIGTVKHWKKVIGRLVQYFGEDRELASITPGEAQDWACWLRTPEARCNRYEGRAGGLLENTARRMVGVARQFFHDAKRRKLIAENPFDGIPASVGPNTEREYFVTREETERLLDVIPCPEWRLLVVLARYGGLRVPSEALELRWGDIDWERRRMVIRSPKTRRKGYGARIVPIFPELAPHLEQAWEAAPEGAEFVITRYRTTEVNLRTQLTRYILKAGLKPWPKLFVAMRQSRAIELAREYPAHVATAWLGHSAQVAMRHYWRVTEADFERAIRGEVGLADSPKGGEVNVWSVTDCGQKCGQVEAKNAAKQASASVCEEEKFLTQDLTEFHFTPNVAALLHVVHKCQWAHEDSNLRPRPYQGRALTN